MSKITIKASGVSIGAEFMQTATALAIYDSLPLSGSVNVWGDEIYFEIPLQLELEDDARQDVDVGDLAYWPSGPAFCIFFGPTPVSRGDAPRAYSPVNVFGRIKGDALVFKTIVNGSRILIEAT